jgi:hypothetical protein
MGWLYEKGNATVSTSRLCATPAQLIPNLIFSGILDRYPRLNWACAETGFGWVSYVLEASDHEWEQRELWKEGVKTRPSEVFRRQIYVDFWYEKAGIELRDIVGVDNIMWESDYPHIAATIQSWSLSKTRSSACRKMNAKCVMATAEAVQDCVSMAENHSFISVDDHVKNIHKSG